MKREVLVILLCACVMYDVNCSTGSKTGEGAGKSPKGDYLKIIVLPFDKLNKERNNELDTLVVGLSDTLSGALSTVNNFVVIDPDRVKKHLLQNMEFKQAIGVDETKDIAKLQELTKNKLEGDFIIYGSFNKIGNNINLSAKFLDLSSGIVNQGANVHGAYPDDIFILQEQLAKELFNKISGGSKQQNSIKEFAHSTGNFQAYQYYIKGRAEYLKFDVKHYPIAIDYYNKALKYDPKYALAWAGLAETNSRWGYAIEQAYGNSAPYYKAALEQGLKAVEYGDNLYQTHLALSNAYQNNAYWDNAERAAEKAYKLNKNDAEVLERMASVKDFDEKNKGTSGTEANKYIMRAIELNPESISARWILASSYEKLKKYDLALQEYKKILSINPDHASTVYNVSRMFSVLYGYNHAESYAIKAIKLNPKNPDYHWFLSSIYFHMNRYQEAIISAENAVKLNPRDKGALYIIAESYFYQSKWDMAYKYYNKVLEIDPKDKKALQWRNEAYENMKKK